jgi:hypothetical protein
MMIQTRNARGPIHRSTLPATLSRKFLRPAMLRRFRRIRAAWHSAEDRDQFG